jgi:hypothetical protein
MEEWKYHTKKLKFLVDGYNEKLTLNPDDYKGVL